MTTITAQEFAQIMRDAIAQIQPAAPAAPAAPAQAPDVFVDVDTQGVIEAAEQTTQAVNSVANIMNPYRDLTREQLVEEFKRMGIRQYQAFDTNTQQELSRKLNFVKLLDEQADVMAAYRERTPGYVPRDMQRLSVDTYASFGQRTARGIPLDAKYMYLPKSIPAATIKFNQKTGMYEMSQDGITDFAKAWRDAERWALSGGSYSDEMKALRKIRDKTLRRDPDQNIIFQARKL
jgi:hypothetical protein